MSIYYFVVWEAHDKKTGKARTISNTIIKDTHPLVWAASPPEPYSQHYITYLRFWEEISEQFVNEIREKHYFNIEE